MDVPKIPQVLVWVDRTIDIHVFADCSNRSRSGHRPESEDLVAHIEKQEYGQQDHEQADQYIGSFGTIVHEGLTLYGFFMGEVSCCGEDKNDNGYEDKGKPHDFSRS